MASAPFHKFSPGIEKIETVTVTFCSVPRKFKEPVAVIGAIAVATVVTIFRVVDANLSVLFKIFVLYWLVSAFLFPYFMSSFCHYFGMVARVGGVSTTSQRSGK